MGERASSSRTCSHTGAATPRGIETHPPMYPSAAGKEGEGARAAAGFGFKVRRRWSEVQRRQMGGRGAAVANGMGARGKVGGDGRRGGQEAADGEGRSPAGQCEARWVSAPGRVAHVSVQTGVTEC